MTHIPVLVMVLKLVCDFIIIVQPSLDDTNLFCFEMLFIGTPVQFYVIVMYVVAVVYTTKIHHVETGIVCVCVCSCSSLRFF